MRGARALEAAVLTLAAAVLAAVVTGCAPTAEEAQAGAPGTGSVKVALSGGDLMATIVVRSVFDHGQVSLIDCEAKDHTVGGESFCDELIVVPPGVYEVIVQSHVADCASELDHYKVVVNENETTELHVKFVCGAENGGLDTIVKVEELPIIEDIDFNFFETGATANKFMCACGGDVTVTFDVSDSDTSCDLLTDTWTATDSSGNDVTSSVVVTDLVSANDLTLFFGDIEVFNAGDPATFQLTATGTGSLAAWTNAGGQNAGGSTNVDFTLTWDAATQTGTLSVYDNDTSTQLLTGTVTGMTYTVNESPLASVFQATILMDPNTLGIPAGPELSTWIATADLTEADPGHFVTTDPMLTIADIRPLCRFSAQISANLPAGTNYTIHYTVTDPEGHEATLNFPIHVIDCGYTCPPAP